MSMKPNKKKRQKRLVKAFLIVVSVIAIAIGIVFGIDEYQKPALSENYEPLWKQAEEISGNLDVRLIDLPSNAVASKVGNDELRVQLTSMTNSNASIIAIYNTEMNIIRSNEQDNRISPVLIVLMSICVALLAFVGILIASVIILVIGDVIIGFFKKKVKKSRTEEKK